MQTSLATKQNINRHGFQVGHITVVPTRDLLFQKNKKCSLEPLVMDLLCVLAEQPGHVIMREDLIDRLWDSDHGGDESLTRAMSMLRKSLREVGAKGEYIETIPKRGYRLREQVLDLPDQMLVPDTTQHIELNSNRGSLLPTVVIVLMGFMAVILIAAMGA